MCVCVCVCVGGDVFSKVFKIVVKNHVAGAKYELPKYVLSDPTNLIQARWEIQETDVQNHTEDTAEIICKSSM